MVAYLFGDCSQSLCMCVVRTVGTVKGVPPKAAIQPPPAECPLYPESGHSLPVSSMTAFDPKRTLLLWGVERWRIDSDWFRNFSFQHRLQRQHRDLANWGSNVAVPALERAWARAPSICCRYGPDRGAEGPLDLRLIPRLTWNHRLVASYPYRTESCRMRFSDHERFPMRKFHTALGLSAFLLALAGAMAPTAIPAPNW